MAKAQITEPTKNRKAASLLKAMLNKLDKHTFERLCVDGKELVLESAELLGVPSDRFAETNNFVLDLHAFVMEFPPTYQTTPQTEDFVVTGKVLHKPTGILVDLEELAVGVEEVTFE